MRKPPVKALVVVGVFIIFIASLFLVRTSAPPPGPVPPVPTPSVPGPPPFPAPPPPPPHETPPEIARVLEGFEWANIVFNTPGSIRLGDSAVIQLLLSQQTSIEELGRQIAAAGKKEGFRIQISDRMEARLTGLGFRIQALTPETQAVSSANTEWKWEIQPTMSGPQTVHLTLSLLLDIEGERVPHTIRTFDRMVMIQVTWPQRLSGFLGQNWQWLWTAILLPLVAWLWGKHNKRKTDESDRDHG